MVVVRDVVIIVKYRIGDILEFSYCRFRFCLCIDGFGWWLGVVVIMVGYRVGNGFNKRVFLGVLTG